MITGGSRSIGRACALAFAREGANVAINYNTSTKEAEDAVTAAKSLGAKSDLFKAATSKSEHAIRMVKDVASRFGKIDILVNNVGVLKRTPFLEISEPEWDWILGTNLKGYFLVGQAVAKHMVHEKIKGAIVNISSAAQELASPNVAHYCTAKAGVAMLTKCMGLELAPFGIRANAVAPGLVETNINRKDLANDAYRERRLSRIPLRMIGKPEDVTGAVLFLSSDEARMSTGQTVFLDAGASISSA